tara:strand:- start:64 stop:699 length:636 start_codon:yes stop_codon:yes gene_type:complete
LKIAFFSDIHGNLPALEIAIREAGKVDGYIILGDVVNYGPWSNECVQMIESLPNCTKIRGNHEDYFISGQSGCNNNIGNEFFYHCYAGFNEMALIKSYEDKKQFLDFICCHTLKNMYVFKDTNIALNTNYIIGHSHQQYEVFRSGFRLLNPGSVGQNRKFINEINFMIYDTKLEKADFRSVLYDVSIVELQMEKENYPEICINYYRNKPRK